MILSLLFLPPPTSQAAYLLKIRAFDNGTPPLFADAWVEVKVIEESKFPPAVTPLNVQIASFLDDFPGGSIGRVKATDRDLYDRFVN